MELENKKNENIIENENKNVDEFQEYVCNKNWQTQK